MVRSSPGPWAAFPPRSGGGGPLRPLPPQKPSGRERAPFPASPTLLALLRVSLCRGPGIFSREIPGSPKPAALRPPDCRLQGPVALSLPSASSSRGSRNRPRGTPAATQTGPPARVTPHVRPASAPHRWGGPGCAEARPQALCLALSPEGGLSCVGLPCPPTRSCPLGADCAHCHERSPLFPPTTRPFASPAPAPPRRPLHGSRVFLRCAHTLPQEPPGRDSTRRDRSLLFGYVCVPSFRHRWSRRSRLSRMAPAVDAMRPPPRPAAQSRAFAS